MNGKSIADVLFLVSNTALILAMICFVLAIIFFVKFKIPFVIGDLSGKNARKSIAKMRSYNEKSGNKAYQSSKTNQNREKLTHTIKGIQPKASENPETVMLASNTAQVSETEETTYLEEGNETTLLMAENEVRGKQQKGAKLQLIQETMLIHTEETIV